MIRVTRGMGVVVAFAMAATLLAGCGGDEKPAATPTSATPATAAPSPTKPFVQDLSKGVVIASCDAGGSKENQLVAYEPVTGDVEDVPLGRATFNLPGDLDLYSNAQSLGGCNNQRGSIAMTAFNYADTVPFSKYFFSRENADGSHTIGYVDRDGRYTKLSKDPAANGLGNIIKDQFPSYHSGTNRVYYMDMSNHKAQQLMSVSIQGGDNRPESTVPGLVANNFSPEDGFYVPNATAPIAASTRWPGVYNVDGKLAGTVGNDAVVVIGPVFNPRLAAPGTKFKLDASSFTSGLRLIGFVPGTNDKALFMTDGMSLYRVEGNQVTTLYQNKTGKKLEDIAMSPRGDLGFLIPTEPQLMSVYVLKAGTTDPKRIARVRGKVLVSILRYW